MGALGGLATGFDVILTPANLYYCLLGSLVGTLVGVLPGIGPLTALALLLPVTFTLTVNVFTLQVTATLVTFALATPVPLATEQVCPAGCAETVTA